MIRMSVWSIVPRIWPATAPTAVPTLMAMSMAATPTAREIRPP